MSDSRAKGLMGSHFIKKRVYSRRGKQYVNIVYSKKRKLKLFLLRENAHLLPYPKTTHILGHGRLMGYITQHSGMNPGTICG